MVNLGLHVNPHRIYSSVHDIDPPLCCRHLKQGAHGFQNIVKVLVCINPFTSQIDAIELGCNISLWVILKVDRGERAEFAAEECSFEVIDANYTTDQEEQQRDYHHVYQTGDGHEQSLDANLESFVSTDYSQRPEDA